MLRSAFLALLLAAAAPATAGAAQSLLTIVDSDVADQSFVQATGGPGDTVRLVVRRGGVPIADRTGPADDAVSAAVAPQRGDQIELFLPAAAPAPARTYAYEPAGTIVACAGAETVSGTIAGVAHVGVFDPGVAASPGVGEQVAGAFSVTLVRELAAGDTVSLAREAVDGVRLQLVRTVGSCGAPVVEPVVTPSPSPSPVPTASPQPVMTAPAPLPATATLTVGKAKLDRTRRKLTVSLTCTGTAACAGTMTLTSGRVRLGRQRIDVPAGTTRKVVVKLSKRVRKGARVKLVAASVTKSLRL